MALLNTSLPNLIGGVSQQPDSIRFEGQCEEQTNAISSVVDGLSKRPNTKHIAKLLSSAIAANSFVHFIDRDDNEKYVVIHDGTALRIFNINDGTQCTINGQSTFTPASSSYLDVSNAISDLKAATVADSTFILNNKKIVQEDSGLSTNYDDKNAGFFVAQGDFEKRYTIDATFAQFANITPVVSTNTTKTFAQIPHDITSVGSDSENLYNESNSSGNSVIDLSTRLDTSLGNNNPFVTGGNYNNRVSSFTVKYIEDVGVEYNKIYLHYKDGSSTNQPFVSIDITAGYTITNGSNSSITITENTSSNISYIAGELLNNTSYTVKFALGVNSAILVSPRELHRSIKSGSSSSASSSINSSFAGAEADTNTIARALICGNKGTGTSTTFRSSVVGANNAGIILAEFSGLMPDGTRVSTYNDQFTGTQGLFRGSTFFLKARFADGFSVGVSDGLANTGLKHFFKEVPSITDLPVECLDGYSVKIVGDAELNQDDYYVTFQTSTNTAFGNGAWVEREGFNISAGLDSSTLPFQLVNVAPNKFVLGESNGQTLTYDTNKTHTLNNYNKRKAGDNDTNPHPSFVGKTISNVFQFKNRLGFLSDDSITLSESGELFNFYKTTVTTLLDSAPIDVTVSSSKVTNLTDAIGFQENLILFSDNAQFVMKGGDLLTPRTVSVTPITNFNFEDNVAPLPLGSYIYYPFTKGNFTSVREFTVNSTTDTYDSTEITEHVPRYIPSNIIAFAGTSSEDAIAIVSANDNSSAYIYRFFFNGQKKLLSSWFKFTFDGEIRGLTFIESKLFIVLAKNNETHVVSMPFDAGLVDTGVNHNTYLDMRRTISVAAGATTIDLSSFYTPADNTVNVFSTDGALIPSTNSGATVTLTNGALSSSTSTNVFVGIPYTMTYTFSKQLFKQASGQSKSPSAGGTMKLKSCSIFYNNTAHFKVKVTPIFRDTYINTFNPDIINTTNIELNLDDGFFRVPVFSNAEDTTITIENSSALPSNFQSAEFEVNAHQRSRRF